MSNGSFDDRVPFTRSQLREAGIDPRSLRGKRYVQLVRNVWVRSDHVNDLSLLRAALLIHPEGAFASHVSAADVLGLPVPAHAFAHVTVFDHEDRRFRHRIKPHVTKRPRKVIWVDGIPTTDPIMTFIDCAGLLGLVDMVILGDAIVKKYKIEPRRLVAACQRSTDYHAKKALFAALFVRKGVDSPMETRLRMLIVLAGLPEPKVNLVRRWPNGDWKRRHELVYEGIKLIIEFDGRHHLTDDRQWQSDLKRREELDDDGYRILVFTHRDVYVLPERMLRRIHRQLVLRGMVGVRDLRDDWRQYFAA